MFIEPANQPHVHVCTTYNHQLALKLAFFQHRIFILSESEFVVMIGARKNVAVFMIILVATVIFLLTTSGSFSRNNAIEKLQYLHKTPQSLGSIDHKIIAVSNPVKDFAIDRTINRPSAWIRNGNSELKVAPTLTKDVIDHIEKFVIFIGYPRSGHSIVGSLIDAHPHMVIANEFLLLRNWKYFSDREKESGESNPFYKHKSYLFNILYKRSYWDTTDGLRNEQSAKKNYTLSMDSSLWQGKFDKYISVIGDKSGGVTAGTYLLSNSTFSRYLDELRVTVNIPIKAIHVVRNPYDQISTCVLYKDHNRLLNSLEVALQDSPDKKPKHPESRLTTVSKYKAAMAALQAKGDNKTFAVAKYESENRLDYCIGRLVERASAVAKIIGLIGPSNVIEVHNTDLVSDPKAAIGKLCSSLEVPCAPDYLQACANKVFKSISRTRDMLHWSPKMKAKVEEDVIQTYPFFSRYSFVND